MAGLCGLGLGSRGFFCCGVAEEGRRYTRGFFFLLNLVIHVPGYGCGCGYGIE